jgi:hypothetical protein
MPFLMFALAPANVKMQLESTTKTNPRMASRYVYGNGETLLNFSLRPFRIFGIN